MADIADYTPNVAIVTGAAQGIGRAIALRLADDGFNIALADLPSKQELLDSAAEAIISKGRKVVVVPTDVSDEQQVVKLIDATAQELGGVDVVSPSCSIRQSQSLRHRIDGSKRRSGKIGNLLRMYVALCMQWPTNLILIQ